MFHTLIGKCSIGIQFPAKFLYISTSISETKQAIHSCSPVSYLTLFISIWLLNKMKTMEIPSHLDKMHFNNVKVSSFIFVIKTKDEEIRMSSTLGLTYLHTYTMSAFGE